MFDARSVSNFFIDRALSEGRALSVMTLLKVLYFAHAWHLVKYGEPLIGQPFEAWKFGPVNRVVYDQCKQSDKHAITAKFKSFSIASSGFVESPYDFNEELTKFLGEIFDYYSKFHAYKLSDLTHEAGAPWDVVWRQADSKAVAGMVIPNSLIRSWFSDQTALYWTSRERESPS
ncbi:Panacea domain-containing protein [Methylorubrum sp. SB2]|uniref:Panacea domain-containing protein n=1 Tax=Methylorubrum subtropicum TaxID=3138812 RepID=UPI00313B160C